MSTQLSVQPDPYTQIRNLRYELSELSEQLSRAQESLRLERDKTEQIERGVKELRTVLSPLYRGLQHVFGEIDAMGIEAPDSAIAKPRKSAVWDSWKEKLGGLSAMAIDVLLLHGEMSVPQLRIHLSCAQRTAQNVAQKLKQAGLAERNGGKISLKDLGQ